MKFTRAMDLRLGGVEANLRETGLHTGCRGLNLRRIDYVQVLRNLQNNA